VAGEYNAGITNFVSTVVVDNWRGSGKTVRMNTVDFYPERDGEIVDGPTQPPLQPGVSDPPLKNPFLDGEGRRIADLHSPLHRA